MTSILSRVLVIFCMTENQDGCSYTPFILSIYMAFKRVQGKTKVMWLPVTTSTAMTYGAVVRWASGLIAPVTSSSAPSTHVGVIQKTIASTDSDYATARLVPVEVPVETNVVWEGAVTATLVAADLGLFVDFTDSLTLNRGASTYDVAQPIKLLSTTLCHCILNLGIGGMGVVGA